MRALGLNILYCCLMFECINTLCFFSLLYWKKSKYDSNCVFNSQLMDMLGHSFVFQFNVKLFKNFIVLNCSVFTQLTLNRRIILKTYAEKSSRINIYWMNAYKSPNLKNKIVKKKKCERKINHSGKQTMNQQMSWFLFIGYIKFINNQKEQTHIFSKIME